jgi:hypothetical protein
MRRTTNWLAVVTALLTLSVAPVLAKPPNTPKGPKTPLLAAKPINTPKGPKTTVARPPAPKTIKASARSTKAAAPRETKATAPKSVRATIPKSADKKVARTPGMTAPVVGRWTPRNPVAQKLSTKPQMLAKVERVLPGITDMNAATAGFKNYGQFVAAVNATQNQGVNFARLKALMTGINLDGTPTGRPTLSLGQAKKVLQTTAPTAFPAGQ